VVVITDDESRIIGEVRDIEYKHYVYYATYASAASSYVFLERILKFIGFVTSVSFIYLRYFSSKMGSPAAETIFSWTGTFASLIFTCAGIWALIFRWSERIKVFPVLSKQAAEIVEMSLEFCEMEHPTKSIELYRKLMAVRKQFDLDRRNGENPRWGCVRNAFAELCRHYPKDPMRCDTCNGERTNLSYRKFWPYLPYLECKQCGCWYPKAQPANS
jgi:hypothetical protein